MAEETLSSLRTQPTAKTVERTLPTAAANGLYASLRNLGEHFAKPGVTNHDTVDTLLSHQ